MSDIKFRGSPDMIAEISDQIDYLVQSDQFELLDAVLFIFKPEECDGMINFCIFMKCMNHRDKLPSFRLFAKRAEQALKNQGEMAMVAAIQNIIL